MKFKIGDKVRVRKDLRPGYEYRMDDSPRSWNATQRMCDLAGEVFTICFACPSYYRLECHYFVWTDEMLEAVAAEDECTQKIVIISDGKESTATLYDGNREIKSAKSVMPNDVDFDFMSYAKSALKHLIKECAKSNSAQSTRYPNGTVVCIENNLDERSFTIGKAYNVADGEIDDNTGFCRELNWLNNDPTSGFCVYNTEDGPLAKFVVFTGPAKIK